MDIRRATRELFRKIIPAIVLAVLIVAALVWFLDAAEQSYRAGDLTPRLRSAGESSPASPVTTVQIQSWMTFDYLNVVFRLPSSYLSSALGITDPRYPNLRIDTYAKEQGIDADTLVGEIQQAIATTRVPAH